MDQIRTGVAIVDSTVSDVLMGGRRGRPGRLARRVIRIW
jgi:hypothetical protein